MMETAADTQLKRQSVSLAGRSAGVKCLRHQGGQGSPHLMTSVSVIPQNIYICVETQKTPTSQNSLVKEKWRGGIALPDFRLYHKAAVIKQFGDGTKTEIQISGTG